MVCRSHRQSRNPSSRLISQIELAGGPSRMHRRFLSAAGVLALASLLSGCIYAGTANDPMAQPSTLVPDTKTGVVLDNLPPPVRPLDVAVYSFPDLTGQNKPNDNFAEFSRAVTQGGSAILADVLTKA